MNTYMNSILTASLVATLGLAAAHGQGFTEPDVIFYGEVRKSGGGQTVLLQSGKLELAFVNQSNPANRVTIKTDLYPVGNGALKAYSYVVKVPLAYLPEAPRIGGFLAVSTLPTSFKIEGITVDGIPATLPDGSKEFYGLNFASRASDNRLDLLVAGDSTDGDHDGLPDWWERIFGLDPTLADANADADNDGWSNLEEFRRGSNPTVSNREPLLVTADILVPESGEAGVYPQVLDSDTPSAGISLTLTATADSGFVIKLDGAPLAAGARQFSLSELQSGRLTIAHTDRSRRTFALPVSWTDGGDELSGEVLVSVVSPSAGDGSDAAVWLDGFELPAAGSPIGNWPDRSGNARHATQPLASYQPVVANRSADFSAGTSAHLFFQDAVMPAGDHTVLAAFSAASSADAPQTLLSTNRGFLQLAATTQPVSYPGAPTYQMDGTASHGYENATGATTTSIFRRQASLLQNILGLSYDGQATAATVIEPVLPTLGARRSAVPGETNPVDQAFGGQLHELLVFPGALAEQKLRGVHDYLQSKWSGAVIWDFSTELKDISLTVGAGSQRRIIRGGFGNDRLGGSAGDDTLSGGAGDDMLTGGAGADRFVFGSVDTGRDQLADFDPLHDIIDLSASFWGMTGDARNFVTVRLDTNYTTPVPTLDSTLIVTFPDGGKQEIVLLNTVIGATQLVRLIVEGHLRMGGLSIPATVQLALAAGSPAGPISEAVAQPFTVNLTRSGAGVPAALDVPLGFFESALGGRFVVDGATSNDGRRAVVSFARGETSKTLNVHPVPDLETTGLSNMQIAVLPQYKYAVGGTPVAQTVSDNPLVWLEVTQPNAIAAPAQPARVVVRRNGSTTQSLVVDFQLGGTAVNGVHIQSVPSSVTLTAGQTSREIQFAARAAGLTAGPKVLLVQLASRDRYLLGNPHEGLVYVGNTAAETNGAGFDRWLQAASQGVMSSLAELKKMAPARMNEYLQAYAFGLASVAELGKHGVTFRIVGGRPELSVPGQFKAADLRWNVQSSTGLEQWAAASGFSQVPDGAGLKLLGQPLASDEPGKFYRLSMSLDPGQLAGSSIAAMTSATAYGISGSATWHTDQATGNLIGSGGNAGDTSRLIANLSGPQAVDFEMAIDGGDWNDALVFYIDGVRQAGTVGDKVRFTKTWSTPGQHLLMWEFTRGSGNAVIRNLAQ